MLSSVRDVLVLDDRLLDHQVLAWQPPDISGAYDKDPGTVRDAGPHGLVLRTVERHLLEPTVAVMLDSMALDAAISDDGVEFRISEQ